MNRRGSAASVLLVAVLLSQVGATSASASDVDVVLEFSSPLSKTVEYGEYWDFPLTAETWFYDNIYLTNSHQALATGGSAPYSPLLMMWPDGSARVGLLAANYEVPPLTVGSYSLSVTGTFVDPFTTWHGVTAAPAHLTVTPAALGIDLRVLADANNPTGAIVSARFTGRFVDEYQPSFYESSAVSPAGEWHITVTDEAGEIAVERNFERSAGDDVLATSFYWTGAKPDEQYSATAEFVPTGASGANFDIATATTFSYTAQSDPRPVPSSTATARPAADLPEPSGFGLPLWALLLGILLILGMGAVVTVLSVRLTRKPSAPITAGVST